MRSIYLILAHKNIEQLRLLALILRNRGAIVVIHIDAKAVTSGKILYNLKRLKNVYVIDDKDRINVNWGGFSQIEATLTLMYKAKGLFCDGEKAYVHLLSGLDFPIKPIEEIETFFEANYGDIFLTYSLMPREGWAFNGGMDRIFYKWQIDKDGYSESFLRYEQQKNVETHVENLIFPEYFGGSQWWSLPAECLLWILHTIEEDPFVKEHFRYALIPDEIFFQTLLMHSPFVSRIQNENYRYIDWCSGPEFPRILTVNDYEELKNSNAYFARKIDCSVNPMLIRVICENLLTG